MLVHISIAVVWFVRLVTSYEEYVYRLEEWDSRDVFSNTVLQETDCVKKAVKILYPNCADGADKIPPGVKRNVAIELSKCEWDASGVAFPYECLVKDYEACVRIIQGSEQLWTSYSGNFRRTAEFCYEFLVPFEKDSILDLYSNISKAYTEFYSSVKKSNHEAMDLGKETNEQLEEILALVNNLVNQWEEVPEKTEKSLNNLNKYLNVSVQQGLEALTKTQDKAHHDIKALVNLLEKAVNMIANETVPKVAQNLHDLETKSHHMYNSLENVANCVLLNLSNQLGMVFTDANALASKFQQQQESMLYSFQLLMVEVMKVMRSEFELSLHSISDITEDYTEELFERLENKIDNNLVQYFTSIEEYMRNLNNSIAIMAVQANQTNAVFHSITKTLASFKTFNPWSYYSSQIAVRLGNAFWIMIVLITVFRWGNFLVLIPFASGLVLTMYVLVYGLPYYTSYSNTNDY